VPLTGHQHLESLVVVVATPLAAWHRSFLPRANLSLRKISYTSRLLQWCA
jgi:hypothetical protein